jgi:hypothetical protein
MPKNTDAALLALLSGEAGGDPVEDRLRETARATIGALCDDELVRFEQRPSI